jgi:DNA ligase-1
MSPNTYDIVDQLAATNSKNEKLAILAKCDDLTTKVFATALDPTILFYVKKPIAYTPRSAVVAQDMYLDEALQLLIDRISTREITGNAAIDYMRWLLESVNHRDADILHRVILKDLRLGFSESSLNKALGRTVVREWPKLLAHKFDQKAFDAMPWETGVYVEEKSDGVRANIVIGRGTVQVMSRNGLPINVGGAFDYLAEDWADAVVDGELLVLAEDGETVLDRKTGNGILNRDDKTPEEVSRIFLNAWDFIPLSDFMAGKSSLPYDSRKAALSTFVEQHSVTNVRAIPSDLVFSPEEAYIVYDRYRKAGKEGTIVKNPNSPWEDKRSKNLVKMKARISATMRVTGTYPGEGKYAGMIGGFIAQTEDGLLESRFGTGLTDADRQKDPAEWIGKLIEVHYNELITNKKDSSIKMFLPVFVELRTDKEVADTLPELQARTD